MSKTVTVEWCPDHPHEGGPAFEVLIHPSLIRERVTRGGTTAYISLAPAEALKLCACLVVDIARYVPGAPFWIKAAALPATLLVVTAPPFPSRRVPRGR